MTNNNFKLKAILFSISLAIIVALGISYQVFALNPPTTQPPTGGGTIGIGSNAPSNSLYILSSGNVGIGTTAPGAKLEVAGQIKITGGSPGSGKVLTSDSSGLATWQAITGTLPSGSSGQTLRHNGTEWVANSLLYNNGTNVGIGTTTPGATLDVQGAAQFGTGNVNLIDSTGKIPAISSTYFASLSGANLTSLNASNLSSGTVPSARISGSYTGITGVGTLTTGTWNASSISTSYTAAKDTTNDSWTGTSNVYTTSGNVGIGTTGPTQKLQVNGAIGAYSDADSWIVLYPGGDVTAIMWDNATSPGGGLQFSTWDTFNSGNYSAKAIITNAGNVGIGTTAPAQKLDVNGTGRFSDTIYLPGTGTNNISPGTGDGATYSTYNFALRGWYGMAFKDYSNTVHGVYNFRTGSLTIDGSVTAAAFYYSSDESLKTNIKPLESGLQKILNLEPVYFDYKENNKHSLGFIAQDVEKQFPELVTTDSLTGLKSLDYSRLTAPLVGAIKEQQEQINSLTQKIESQQEQIEELKNLLK